MARVMALATFTLVQALVSALITPIIAAIFGEPTIEGLSFLILPYKAYQERKGISPQTRSCPECASAIPVVAKRCPRCTATVLPESG